MMKRIRVDWKAAACLIALGAAAGCNNGASAAAPGGGRGRGGRGGDGGGVPVVTAQVGEKDVPIDIPAIGNVEAFSTVSIRSQVTGVLKEALVEEGAVVKAGDPLFTIDPRSYQAMVAQAEAALTRDQALLAQAEAQLNRDGSQAEYSQVTAERNAQLSQRGIISKDTAEQSRAGADATAATVNADKAAVQSARAQVGAQQAAVDNAQLSLGYTSIRSPITGRTGTLLVKPGNLVTANTTELLTIAHVDTVFVTFAVPASRLASIKRFNAEHPLTVNAVAEDEGGSATGRLSFLDNNVDPSTDSIKLKAIFDNADRRLWPGEFVRVQLRLTTLKGAAVVPSEAVQTGQDGQFVFVVKPDSTVEQRSIVSGDAAGEDVVVQKGLQPGDRVVTQGQLRLEPGSRVQTGEGRGGGRGQTGAAPNRQGRGQRAQ